jgi:hypothetical protein
MTAPSRRAALTALAGFPALAIPAVAATVAPSPDAEILALRAEFVRLHDLYLPLNEAAWEEAEAFRDKVEEAGWEAARAWSKATGRNGRNDELDQMGVKLSRLVERMLDLRPTTPAGIAAVAATLREDNLAHYWNKPARNRDYDVELVTRFIDGLIGATVGGAA